MYWSACGWSRLIGWVGRLAAAAALWSGALGAALPGPAPCRAAAGVVTLQETAIGEDTVWEGAVEVRGLVTVQKGATLLVLPGTTVTFAAGRPDGGESPAAGLLVNGTLVAQGTPAQPIVFTSAADKPSAGDWRGIEFESANERPSRLGHCVIEYADTGLAGSMSLLGAERVRIRRCRAGIGAGRLFAAEILDAEITENGTGIGCNQGSGLLVMGSRIAKNTDAGVYCTVGSSPRIVGNEIAGNGSVGVSCFRGSSPQIEGNLVTGHGIGVHVELQSRPQIVRNDIVGNDTGLRVEKHSFPLVAANLIARNGLGISCDNSGYPEIRGNNLLDNARFAIALGDNQSIHSERKIPFRDKGRHFDSVQPSDAYPIQSRKDLPFPSGEDGVVDARGNWWGEGPAREMETAGDAGNVSVIEDFHDKPDTFYNGVTYPRDRVAYAPWEKAALAAAGRQEGKRSSVAGKVLVAGAPAPGVRLHAYSDASGPFAGEGQAYSAPTGPDGDCVLPLPPGSWYLVAKAAVPPFPQREPEEGGVFGYYGGNPVTLAVGERRDVTIQAVRRRQLRVEPAGTSDRAWLAGVVIGPKGPVWGASVFVYADASRHFRGPDLSGPQGTVPEGTDSAGHFEAELPPGKYFVVAVRRAGGEALGPLKAGDLFGWFDGNPVELAAGTRTTVAIQAVEKLKEREPQPLPPARGRTGIRGAIRDPSGAVPAGVYAYATTDPKLITGSMPPYRSAPVGPDGSFFIDLPGAGTYYVGARSGFGGPPLPGQWHGVYGVGTPTAVTVGAETVAQGIDITVGKVK